MVTAGIGFMDGKRFADRASQHGCHLFGLFLGCRQRQLPGRFAMLLELRGLELDSVDVVHTDVQHPRDQRLHLGRIGERDDEQIASRVTDRIAHLLVVLVPRFDGEVVGLYVLVRNAAFLERAAAAFFQISAFLLFATSNWGSRVSIPKLMRILSGLA